MHGRRSSPAPKQSAALIRRLLIFALLVLLTIGPVPPRSIRGLPIEVIGVVGRYGNGPLEGARVFVIENPVRYETRTDRHGFFRLVLPSLGSGEEAESTWFQGYRFAVQAEGMVDGGISFALENPLPDDLPISLGPVLLSPVAGLIGGMVRDERGVPVPGATVECGSRENVTGSDGRFEPFPVPAGQCILTATAAGLAGRMEAFVYPGAVDRLDVEVPVVPTGTDGILVASRLVEPDGSPAAGIRVTCESGTVFTDAKGDFEIRIPSRDRWVLLCYEGASYRGRIFPEPEDPPVRRLPPLAPVDILVRDEVTGYPLPDVMVSPFNLMTDTFGRLRAELPDQTPPGFKLTLRKPGYRKREVDWHADQESSEFSLSPRGTVRLRAVTDDGEPITGAVVWFRAPGQLFWSDENGNVAARLPSGPCYGAEVRDHGWEGFIRPRGDGAEALFRRLLVAVGLLDGSDQAPSFRLKPGGVLDLGTCSLRYVDPQGGASPPSMVRVVDPDGAPIPFPIHVSSFQILRAGDSAGVIEAREAMLAAQGFETMILTAEQIAGGIVTLRPAPPLTGRLVFQNGKPAAGIEVYAKGIEEKQLCTMPATSDPLGRFVLHGIPIGVGARIWTYVRGVVTVRGRAIGGQKDVRIVIGTD